MILKKLWSVDKKLPNVYFDERAKSLEGKKMLMMNGSKQRKSAGVLHSIITYVISTILAIFFLLLLLAILFDVNVCVSCLASYPEVIKDEMNDQGLIISNYDHKIVRDLSENPSNVDIMTTESAGASTETALVKNLKNLRNMEMDRAEINVLDKDTPPEKMAMYQNHESVTYSMKNISHNKYPDHDKVSEGGNTTKNSINKYKHGSNDKNIAKELSDNFTDLGIITISDTIPKTETNHSMTLKEQSKDSQKMEIDRALILLLQSMLYSGIEDKKHETITYSMMNNMHDAYQNHDKVSDAEIPMKKIFNENKHNSNPIIMADMHQIIRLTPFKLKTHFRKFSETIKNDDENTEIPNANQTFPDERDGMDTTTEHYTVLEEKNDERERPILIEKLQQLPYLSNNLKNPSPSDTKSKIIIRIISNPKKVEGSYKTTLEQDINENKSYSEKTETALNDLYIQPSYINKDGLPSHSLMRHKLRNNRLKLSSMKITPSIKYEHEEFPFKHFSDFSNDRIIPSHSKTKLGRQILKEKKKAEIYSNLELTSPPSPRSLNESGNSSQINQKMANALKELITQPSFLSNDDFSSHSLMRNNVKTYPLKHSATKNASPINYEYEDAFSKFFPEVPNDRMFLSLLENKLDKQLLKEREKIEMNYSPELISPSTPIFLNKFKNSSQIDDNATDKISDHIFKYFIALKDPIKTETIENTKYRNLNNDTEITNRESDLKLFLSPTDKTLKKSSSISISENKYLKPKETLLNHSTKDHYFNELLQIDESTPIDKSSRKPFSSKESHNEEQSETDKFLPKSTKKNKMKLLSKFQKKLYPTVLIAEKPITFEREDDAY